MISQWSSEFSQLNSLLTWAFSWHGKKIKINGIMNGSVTFKQYEIYFHTLNTELCRLCSFFFLLIPAKKMYSQISEKPQLICLIYLIL